MHVHSHFTSPFSCRLERIFDSHIQKIPARQTRPTTSAYATTILTPDACTLVHIVLSSDAIIGVDCTCGGGHRRAARYIGDGDDGGDDGEAPYL